MLDSFFQFAHFLFRYSGQMGQKETATSTEHGNRKIALKKTIHH